MPQLWGEALNALSRSNSAFLSRPDVQGWPSAGWASGWAALAGRLALVLVLAVTLLLGLPEAGQAAEVLQVRSGTVLQIGDGNRNYTVRLACLAVSPETNAEAVAWLRQQLPRRSRVNLRPVGSEDGLLVARVSRLDGGASGSARSPALASPRAIVQPTGVQPPGGLTLGVQPPSSDLGQGLVDAGLASWLPNCSS